MLFDLIKSALMGMIQGIAEWLPISSGGHLMLFNALLPLKNVGEDFWPLYDTVIQLGSILAVVVLYFHRLNPFALSKSRQEKRETWEMWFKIIVAVIPSGLIGVALNDWIDAHLDGPVIIAIALIVYGVIFLLLDRLEEGRHARRIGSIQQLSYRTAFLIGCFQVLALIPGTSRSGSTIIGALLLGLTRTTAVEFSFFMARPPSWAWASPWPSSYPCWPSGPWCSISAPIPSASLAFIASPWARWCWRWWLPA